MTRSILASIVPERLPVPADCDCHGQRWFCAHPDTLRLGERECKWAQMPVSWTAVGTIPGVSADDFKAAAALAWSTWARHSGVKLVYTENTRTANVIIDPGVIDRSGQVLAWSELPCSGQKQLKQLYDTMEAWSLELTAPRGKISLPLVIIHEAGHALGLGHGPVGNIMAPTLNSSLSDLQAWDVAEIQARYGRPTTTPPAENGLTGMLILEFRRGKLQSGVFNGNSVMPDDGPPVVRVAA